jgi:tetratricopeptide (TPR) repeat protein
MAKDPLEDRCAELIGDLAREQLLWRGGIEIGDTLLSIPVYLVRVELENSVAGSSLERVGPAQKFTKLVAETWPDSLAGVKARLATADLYAILGRYEEALSEIDAALLRNHPEVNRNENLLFRAEVLGHGLSRFTEAESLLTAIRQAAGPSTPISRAAALDFAAIRIKTGHIEEGTRVLLELELAGDTPAETKAAAMLLRAICLLDHGDWPESLHILWRICRLLPFTRASMVAPLIILRRELDTEGTQRALEVQGKVAEFYLSAIERGSASWRYRHLVQDCLIESYLMVNDPRGAAAILEERAPKWNDDAGSVGLFKSSLIYLHLLGDQENGVRMLKKSLDAFPQSRYSKIVRGHLEAASHRKAVD